MRAAELLVNPMRPLVVGEEAENKLDEARRLGVTLLDERAFRAMVKPRARLAHPWGDVFRLDSRLHQERSPFSTSSFWQCQGGGGRNRQ